MQETLGHAIGRADGFLRALVAEETEEAALFVLAAALAQAEEADDENGDKSEGKGSDGEGFFLVYSVR